MSHVTRTRIGCRARSTKMKEFVSRGYLLATISIGYLVAEM
jgi:hypothetical protein